jgi:hypothetical protein
MPERNCSLPDCTRKHLARGLCKRHYDQANPVAPIMDTFPCSWCGVPTTKARNNSRPIRFCSLPCRETYALAHGWKKPPPRKPKVLRLPVDMRSPIRRAYEDADWVALTNAIKADTALTERGCWEWQRTVKRGYAVTAIGKKMLYVHRLSVLAKTSGLLGPTPVVHHECANTICVNPDHLSPVTQRENNAEMLERNYYLNRIAELEAALSEIDAVHPLLAQRKRVA